mmetsp:Transcript_43286/g.139095  ORF Transcript_43286/g.139095 Transcript_43286/m.139095 type:complete len:263 (-) Transcript_43286:232-1020(-)
MPEAVAFGHEGLPRDHEAPPQPRGDPKGDAGDCGGDGGGAGGDLQPSREQGVQPPLSRPRLKDAGSHYQPEKTSPCLQHLACGAFQQPPLLQPPSHAIRGLGSGVPRGERGPQQRLLAPPASARQPGLPLHGPAPSPQRSPPDGGRAAKRPAAAMGLKVLRNFPRQECCAGLGWHVAPLGDLSPTDARVLLLPDPSAPSFQERPEATQCNLSTTDALVADPSPPSRQARPEVPQCRLSPLDARVLLVADPRAPSIQARPEVP